MAYLEEDAGLSEIAHNYVSRNLKKSYQSPYLEQEGLTKGRGRQRSFQAESVLPDTR